MDTQSFNELIQPFFWVEHKDAVSVCLSVGDYKSEIFKSRADEGFEGSGYDWASLAQVFLEEQTPELMDVIRFDPEAGMFCAYSLEEDDLKAFVIAFKEACENEALIKDLFSRVKAYKSPELRKSRFGLFKLGVFGSSLVFAPVFFVLIFGGIVLTGFPDFGRMLELSGFIFTLRWPSLCVTVALCVGLGLVVAKLMWKGICLNALIARWPVGTNIEAFIEAFGPPDKSREKGGEAYGFYRKIRFEGRTIKHVTVVTLRDKIECFLNDKIV